MNARYVARRLRDAGARDVGLDERRGPTYVHFRLASPERPWEDVNTPSNITVTDRGVASATIRMPAVDEGRRWQAGDAAREAAGAAVNHDWTSDVKKAPLGTKHAAHVYLARGQDVTSVDAVVEDMLAIRSAYRAALRR